MTQELWEGPRSWQEPSEPHPAHMPFRKGKGLVQENQGAVDRADLPAALPCTDTQLMASLGDIILNLVLEVLVRRDWKWSVCSQGHLAISRRQSLGMEVLWRGGLQLLKIIVERDYICFTSFAKRVW